MKLVEIGRVTRPHGVAGEVRVHLHWEHSDTLLAAREIWLKGASGSPRAERVVGARPVPKGVLLQLEGVRSRDDAERLRGLSVCVPREALPEPEEGEYYLCDLVGARVVSPDGDVGEVVEIRTHPSVDSIVIRTPDGTTVEQPLVDPWIESVDVVAGIVELSSKEGLI